MRATPMSSLRSGPLISKAVPAAQEIQASIAGMSPLLLGAASNPLVRKAIASGMRSRLFSTTASSYRPLREINLPGGLSISSPPARHHLLPMSPFQPIMPTTMLRSLRANTTGPATVMQRSSFGTGGFNRDVLASREAAANRNPTSASAQNAFYQALLKANMPSLVMERYTSGRVARNAASDEAFHRAQAMSGKTSGGDVGTGMAGLGENGLANHPSGLSPTQLQAVSQALAAQSKGSNIAIAKGTQGAGTKDGPIHVVVDESIGGVFFRWIKFVLWFCLFTYLSLVVVTMMIDGLNTFKRTGGRQDSEVKPENQTTRFSDVHGCDEAKEELQELVEFLRNPDKFSTLGGKLPKGILLVGPPGTGKTLLARAVAGEAGVPFFYMSGSEFDEVYVGVGAKRVRDLFTSAKTKSPAIIFIDELDAIGGRRNARDAAYVKQTLNQLLTELDGFEQNSGVIIIAATNFPQLLDKALTRPGRFDRHVQVDLPDARGRLAILQHHAKKIKMATGIDLQAIAQTTPGLSGAELENIVNQAAVHASRSKAESVTVTDFDWARDKVLMGAERRSMVISPKEKEMTAYHEAGHALVSYFAKVQPRKLYKVTVLPRGGSLGHTSQLPDMDRYSQSAQDFLAMIEVSLGGKVAEEIVYGSDMVTSGVSSVSDFESIS